MAPIIGITCKRPIDMENYVNAIEEFGGEPLLLASLEKSVSEHRASIREYLEKIDGLLLPGGGDIHPALFFQARHATVSNVSRSRDALEIWLCQDALERDLPVFGICRGIQIMSVAMRGSLYQDIDDQFPGEVSCQTRRGNIDSRHEIEIAQDSLLNEITGDSKTEVNSAHHQAVKDIGKGFKATAYTKEGVIEAMENPSKRFVLGVQYHPERMTATPEFLEHRRKLFEAFIRATSR